MIKKDTIDVIMDTARIDEVVSDFVTLKKRGINLIGLCPFHNEKTPSFNVNTARGIYKCFGCGKGGNAVNFIMEHEHYSYPEALRYLAAKYNITVEEDERTEEGDREQLLRESLMVVTDFAKNFFIKQLHESDEGRAVGMTYFHEREFTDSIIDKFQLGYSPESWTAFTDHALASGYLSENLEKAGFTIASGEKKFDRFRGRVMFPIHNVSGKVIGFGGRILKSDTKTAKYVNSPESEIYHKSKILYGLFFAKKSIVAQDECFLVEGYTDVISLHQAGIENVVASSGTALTVEQIRLIRRYTRNITILYDGDPAGIKASMRGIDLILEEGMNVRVVLFPDGEDPDSFARKHNTYEVAAFVREHSRDFISFKTSLLLKDVAGDPVKKAGLIRNIVETIAKIPDPIIRSTYIKDCSTIMEIGEQILITEMNKIIRRSFNSTPQPEPQDEVSEVPFFPEQPAFDTDDTSFQEADLIRLLLNYGSQDLEFTELINEREQQIVTESVMSFIVHELDQDGIRFEHPVYSAIFNEFKVLVKAERPYDAQSFVHHAHTGIRETAADLLSVKYPLADWPERGIVIKSEVDKLKHAVVSAVYSIKIKQVNKLIQQNREAIKEAASNDTELIQLLEHQKKLDSIKSKLSEYLSIVVLK
jgi:DNA primase